MDQLSIAAVVRAKSALDMAINANAGATNGARAKAFVDIAWAMLNGGGSGPSQIRDTLHKHTNPLVQKAAAHTLGEDLWQFEDAASLAASYIASIAEGSLLDQMARYARILPRQRVRVMVASGFTANVTLEGDPKVVRHLNLSVDTEHVVKSAAIVVLTDQLSMASGAAGRALFENELSASIMRATNLAVLDEMTTSSTIEVATTGDPLDDLRAGLRAAAPSNGYVVAAPSDQVIDLATRVENRGGMGVRGGTFIPGVEVVAMDGLTDMRIIPASRVAIYDAGLEVRSASHATVNMADTPTSPSELVSLWQTDSLGLLAERNFHLMPAAEMVIVGTP